MSYSTRAETLRYSDLSSDSSGGEREPLPRYESRPSQKRVTISERNEVFPESSIQKLLSTNDLLTEENVLLKEQLDLREEALRLHGLHILSDVVHLLDQQHIYCEKQKDLPSHAPTSSTYEERTSEEEKVHRSPYDHDIQNEHRYLASLARGDNHYMSRDHRKYQSFSVDSDDVGHMLEKNRSLDKGIGKPKHTSTPMYKKKARSRSAARKRESNCNVNARHSSPEMRNRSRLGSSLRYEDLDGGLLESEDYLESSYFPRSRKTIAAQEKRLEKEKKKRDLIAHWEECEHRHLHVAPSKPPPQHTPIAMKYKPKTIDRKLHPKKVDLNRTYSLDRKYSKRRRERRTSPELIYEETQPVKTANFERESQIKVATRHTQVPCHSSTQTTNAQHAGTQACIPRQRSTQTPSPPKYKRTISPTQLTDSLSHSEGMDDTSIEIKPSTSKTHRQSTGTTQEQSTGMTHRQSTGTTYRQSTGTTQEQSTGMTHRQSTGMTHRQSTGMTHRQSTGMTHKQSTGTTHEQPTGTTHEQSTGMTHEQSTGMTPRQSTGMTPKQSTGMTHEQSTDMTHEQPTGMTHRQSTGTTYRQPTGMIHQQTHSMTHKLPMELNKQNLLETNKTRLLGEIAFQLDKRILSFVLNGKFNKQCKYKSFYGYNVVNLQQRIIERESGEMKEVMLDRYRFLMQTLHTLGYEFPYHSNFAVMLVNKYGVMKHSVADIRRVEISVHDEPMLREHIKKGATSREVKDTLVLLQCLAVMAADDGMPLFIW